MCVCVCVIYELGVCAPQRKVLRICVSAGQPSRTLQVWCCSVRLLHLFYRSVGRALRRRPLLTHSDGSTCRVYSQLQSDYLWSSQWHLLPSRLLSTDPVVNGPICCSTQFVFSLSFNLFRFAYEHLLRRFWKIKSLSSHLLLLDKAFSWSNYLCSNCIRHLRFVSDPRPKIKKEKQKIVFANRSSQVGLN